MKKKESVKAKSIRERRKWFVSNDLKWNNKRSEWSKEMSGRMKIRCKWWKGCVKTDFSLKRDGKRENLLNGFRFKNMDRYNHYNSTHRLLTCNRFLSFIIPTFPFLPHPHLSFPLILIHFMPRGTGGLKERWVSVVSVPFEEQVQGTGVRKEGDVRLPFGRIEKKGIWNGKNEGKYFFIFFSFTFVDFFRALQVQNSDILCIRKMSKLVTDIFERWKELERSSYRENGNDQRVLMKLMMNCFVTSL